MIIQKLEKQDISRYTKNILDLEEIRSTPELKETVGFDQLLDRDKHVVGHPLMPDVIESGSVGQLLSLPVYAEVLVKPFPRRTLPFLIGLSLCVEFHLILVGHSMYPTV